MTDLEKLKGKNVILVTINSSCFMLMCAHGEIDCWLPAAGVEPRSDMLDVESSWSGAFILLV